MKHILTACAVVLAGAAVWAQQPKKGPCDPANGGLTLPAGFCASIAADNLGLARHMVVSPRGDLYVMLMRQNDADHRPVGLAQARDGSILVSDDVKGRIWRISYTGAR